jgi:putative methyltransferase
MRKRIYIAALNEVPYIPLIYGYLRVFCETDPVLVDNYSFEQPFYYKTSVQEVLDTMENPAVLGLSCYVWNFRRNMKIARLTKLKYPNCLIVAGGPHIPRNIEDFFQCHPYVDITVFGEGEYAFREILREYLKTSPVWDNVPGIAYHTDETHVSGQSTRKLPKTIDLPSPYLLGYFDEIIDDCLERKLKFTASWETNRGCPYGCTFCDWGMDTMNNIRTFDKKRLLAEIKFFSEKKIYCVFICDANFGILKRDVELAQALSAEKRRTGYPGQIKVNFAKHTNNAVFEISSAWNKQNLLMGTTISLQSNDNAVLEAVKRKNIKKDFFFQLQDQYMRDNIDTYTELILGLPQETLDSFKHGINQILLSNSHDDLRVYELNLLPNAPMNDPAYIKKHGIVTMEKFLFSGSQDQAEDEMEVVDLVVETNTMSRRDWIECNVFSQIIQGLHNGCYTKYISILMQRMSGMDYTSFYDGLSAFFVHKPDTVLGTLFNDMHSLYELYLTDKRIPMATLIYSQKHLYERISEYGQRKGWTVSNYCWLFLASHINNFYYEIELYLESLNTGIDKELLKDLIQFQKQVMLRIDYDPNRGKTLQCQYDFPAYFASNGIKSTRGPDKCKVTIKFRDKYMGINNQYKLQPFNKPKFAKAAVGLNFPIVRVRQYQHQFDRAEIVYEK